MRRSGPVREKARHCGGRTTIRNARGHPSRGDHRDGCEQSLAADADTRADRVETQAGDLHACPAGHVTHVARRIDIGR
jgi:hypothetical protein